MACDLNSWPACAVRCPVVAALGLCCLLVTFAEPASARTAIPTLYGEYFVRLGESWPDAGEVVNRPEPIVGSVAPDKAGFQRQIDLFEEAGGPYADALAEPLADLGRLYQRSGELGLAQRAYRRALHIVRVNEGLHSQRQIPILRELFTTYRASGDMETLDGRYDYFFRLYGSGEPPYTAVRLGAALEYLRWQRAALRLELDDQDTQRMLAAHSLNERLLEAVAEEPSVDFASYRALVFSQMRNLYLVQARHKPRVDMIASAAGPGLASHWEEEDVGERRLENLAGSSLSRGRRLLEELIERTPPEQVAELAGAWLELADWYQWNDQRSRALAAYAEVAQLLQDAGETDLLRQWLGQPVELPANGAYWQPPPLADAGEPIVVQAQYDVSASGRASNIAAAALIEEYEGKAGRVKRKLAKTRFRPRITNGEPQAQTQLQREYQVLE